MDRIYLGKIKLEMKFLQTKLQISEATGKHLEEITLGALSQEDQKPNLLCWLISMRKEMRLV